MKITNRLLAHKDKIIWLAIFWTAFVFYACLTTKSNIPRIKIKNLDKLVHLCFHFGITFFWFLHFKFPINNNFKKAAIKAFAFSFILGIIIEMCQKFLTTTRNADFIDVLANTIGALGAILFLYIVKNKLKTSQ